MRTLQLTAVICAAMLLVACGITPPKPQHSEYFQSNGGGFLIERLEKNVRYGINLASKGNAPVGSYIVVEYENPAGGVPLLSSHRVQGDEVEFSLKSPPIRGLRANSNYLVTVYLYANEDRNTLLGKHKQRVQSLFNQSDFGWDTER